MPVQDPAEEEDARVSARRYGAVEIAVALRREIQHGTYVHGERLPAERHLARQFGTSRGTARQALNQLETMKLVTRRIGSGTYVNSAGLAGTGNVAEATSPLELIDARFAVEPEMTRLAVLNASSRDLHDLRRALERVESATDPDRFGDDDEAFHLVLAECSGNPLITSLCRQINEVRGHSQWTAMKKKVLTPERMAAYNDEHRRLYQAIVSRDAGLAIRVMRGHLTTARNDLIGARESMEESAWSATGTGG